MNGSSKLQKGIWKQWYCLLTSWRCAILLDKHCDRNMTYQCILRPIIRAFVACSELLIVPSRTISELSTAQTTGLPQRVCLKSTLRVSSICHRDLWRVVRGHGSTRLDVSTRPDFLLCEIKQVSVLTVLLHLHRGFLGWFPQIRCIYLWYLFIHLHTIYL